MHAASDPMPETALDAAMQRMAASPEAIPARLAFHAELARGEVFVLLRAESIGGTLEPQVFPLQDGAAVLAFDSEMRLAGFVGAAAYAALPGRVLVAMLAGAPEDLSLLINPDADHAALLDPASLRWLAETLATPAPEPGQAVPERFVAPALSRAALDLLIPALERGLSGTPGLVQTVLAGVIWQGGGRGHVLALSGPPETAQPPLARAVAEALMLSGLEAGTLDVVFPPADSAAAIARAGLVLSPAAHVAPDDQIVTPGANPGLDPTRPPKLR